jgi:hypothetical protein
MVKFWRIIQGEGKTLLSLIHKLTASNRDKEELSDQWKGQD